MAVSTIEEQAAHVWKILGEANVLCYRHVRNKAALEELTDHLRDAKTLYCGLMSRLGYSVSTHGEVTKKEEEVA